MNFKEKICLLYNTVDIKFKEQFGFKIRDTTITNVVNYLHEPKDASSLAVTRILFGLLMMFDIPDERGGSHMYKRWDPKICHFPLFNFIQAIPMPYMTLVYTGLWFGAMGIMLGNKYRVAASFFTICYWYLFVIEKSYWNNHSYLFGLVGLLLTFTKADCYWSIDSIQEPERFRETVPYWNYFILKFQFFILYFMAGVKKGSAEWLTGYSVQNLSAHWVFTPFTLFLTVEQTDYLIVHWFIFLFDLTVAFWMMWSRTRHVAMLFCALFHLMNSRLFAIGMFPWVCLATMPLFYPFDWPKTVIHFVKSRTLTLVNKICKIVHKYVYKDPVESEEIDTNNNNGNDNISEQDDFAIEENETEDDDIFASTSESEEIVQTSDQVDNIKPEDNITSDTNTIVNQREKTKRNKHQEADRGKTVTTVFIIIYVIIQVFLPFSHFITKGYNNWTAGLYGYSWDMMVHTWNVHSVVVKVVDNERNNHLYIDPNVLSPNDRWLKHGDMAHQYAMCLRNNLLQETENSYKKNDILSKNISIYIDVWSSMNGRFFQRVFDPNVDLLQVSWSTFERIPFLMPLLDEASEWRSVMSQIRNHVHSWNQYSDVIFFADFSGYVLEKYIPLDLNNVTITILEGKVGVEPVVTAPSKCQSFTLSTGLRTQLDSGMFHRILNIGKHPAYYMLTFYNETEAATNKTIIEMEPKPKLPLWKELQIRLNNMLVFTDLLSKGIYQSFFRLRLFLV